MRIYFTRHGESEANTLRIISNRDLPHPLTEKGRFQASMLAEKLHGKSITRIYTSPIPRARETAEILSLILDVQMECVDVLREPDCGVLEGRGDGEAWKEHNSWKENWFHSREQDRGPKGGETCKDAQNRLTIFIKDLVAEYGKTASEFILVTHGALMLYGLPVVLSGVDHQFIFRHGLGHTVLVIAELQEGKLACTGWEPV
jgi:broad specificity phosphatase PhoE